MPGAEQLPDTWLLPAPRPNGTTAWARTAEGASEDPNHPPWKRNSRKRKSVNQIRNQLLGWKEATSNPRWQTRSVAGNMVELISRLSGFSKIAGFYGPAGK